MFSKIEIPNNFPYLSNDGYHDPVVGEVGTDTDSSVFSYMCNKTTPYVALTTIINEVEYQIDSKDNLLYPYSTIGHQEIQEKTYPEQ